MHMCMCIYTVCCVDDLYMQRVLPYVQCTCTCTCTCMCMCMCMCMRMCVHMQLCMHWYSCAYGYLRAALQTLPHRRRGCEREE